jgi:hypothetical protein
MRLRAAAAALALLPCLLAASPDVPAPSPAPGVTTPCGAVDFNRAGPPRTEGKSVLETIAARFTFADHHYESAVFPYPWVYGDAELTDPWSITNQRRGDFHFAMRMPPRGTDTSAYPPLIRYLLAHTNAAGYGHLPNCPAYGPPTTWPDAQGMDFVDDSAADSPVELLDPRNYALGCVSFRNRTQRTLAIVHFTLTNVDADGRAQKPERIDRFGSFAPGVPIEGIPRGMDWGRTSNNMLRNCRWNYPWTPAFRTVRIDVTGAQFADGSTWTPGSTVPPPASDRKQ